MPARPSRGTDASSTVPQAWPSPHRPTHFAVCQPHSVHRKAAVDFAMAAPYRPPPTFRTAHDPGRPALWLRLRPVGPEHKLDLTTHRETGGGMTTLSGLPAIPVVLSTSSV